MKIDDDDDDFVSVSEWARSKYKILKKHIGLLVMYNVRADLHMNRDVISDL